MEKRYCSYCGNRLEPEARFCSNCGRPVERADSTPETDAPTSQLPTSQSPQPQTSPQASPQPQPQPRWEEQRGRTAWYHGAGAQERTLLPGGVARRVGISWPAVALAVVFIVLIVVETVQGGISDAIRAVPLVAVVVLVATAVSYLSLTRRGGATFLGAVLNWSVVVLAAFATFLFLIS